MRQRWRPGAPPPAGPCHRGRSPDSRPASRGRRGGAGTLSGTSRPPTGRGGDARNFAPPFGVVLGAVAFAGSLPAPLRRGRGGLRRPGAVDPADRWPSVSSRQTPRAALRLPSDPGHQASRDRRAHGQGESPDQPSGSPHSHTVGRNRPGEDGAVPCMRGRWPVAPTPKAPTDSRPAHAWPLDASPARPVLRHPGAATCGRGGMPTARRPGQRPSRLPAQRLVGGACGGDPACPLRFPLPRGGPAGTGAADRP